MKKSLLLIALIIAWFAPDSRAQAPQSPAPAPASDAAEKKTAKLQGQVINQATGEPVRKANLTLRPQPDGTTLAAVSDNDGKFSIDNIDPGRYTLSAERQGFVTQVYGAKRPNGGGITLDLRASQVMKDLSFKLTPQGIIAGRVLDDEGEAVSGVSVVAMQYRYIGPRKRLLPTSAQGVTTNDLGEYRIPNLGPGRYFIASTSQKLANIAGSPERAAAKGPEEALVPSYYPNAADVSAASQVDVGPGAEVRGIDIRLRKARVYRVRGNVVNDSTGSPLSPASLVVYRRDSGGMSTLPMSISVVQDPKGAFELKNVPPGSYSLLIVSPNPLEMKIVTLDVVDQDLNDFAAHFGSGVDIPVTVKRDDVPAASTTDSDGKSAAAPAVDFSNVRIGLLAEDSLINSPTSVLGKEEKTVLKGVPVDKYRLYSLGLPDGAYLKSATFADQDALAAGVDLRQGATGSLQLTFGLAAAQVSATVHNDKGDPVQGAHVTVIPVDPKGRIDLARAGEADQHGSAEVHGIVPGEYNVFAWEDFEPGAAADQEYIKPFLSLGVPVKLSPGAKESLQLTLITREAVDQVNAKR